MRRIGAFLGILALCAGVAAAQDEEAPEARAPSEAEAQESRELEDLIQDVDEVVVIGRRGPQTIFESAASVERIEQERLTTHRAPSTFPDALREIPGVMTQKTGPGLGSPFIRGLTGFRTVLLVDGIRVNHSVFREGPNQYWATVDPLGLGRIEIMKGPASVQWGSDAAGGTVLAYTGDVGLGVEGEGWDVGGRTYYRFNSAEASHTARAEFRGSYDGRFGFRIGATYRNFGDTDAGGDVGRQELSYDSYAADAKIRWLVHDDLELEFLFQTIELNEVPRAHSTIDGVSFHGTTVGTNLQRDFDQERQLAVLTARLFDGPFFEEAEFKVGYQTHDETQDRIRASGRRDVSGFDLDTIFAIAQFTSETSIGELVYGFDLYLDLVDSFARRFTPPATVTRFEQGPVGDDAHYLTFGVFLQDTFDVGDWGEVTLGVRYTHIDTDVDEVVVPAGVGSLERTFDLVVGHASLLAHLTDDLNAYGRASMGFRAPNLSDLTRLDSNRSNEIETPAPDLDEEFFIGLEAGLRYRGRRVSAQAAYFYTFLFDTIVRTPTGLMIGDEFEVTKQNAGDGHIHGVEIQAAWEIVDDVTLRGQFAWTEGQVETFPTSAPFKDTEPLSRTPPIYARFFLDWRPQDCGFWVEGSVEIASEADRLNTRDKRDTQRIPPGGTPGYTIYNLRMGYDVNEDLSLFLHLDNLTDKNYRIHGSGSQEAGFSAIVGFDFRF